LKPIIITEHNWGPNVLRDSITGKMCCLGFAAEQCGVKSPFYLDSVGLPNRIDVNVRTPELRKFNRAIAQKVSPSLQKELFDALKKHKERTNGTYKYYKPRTRIAIRDVLTIANDSALDTGLFGTRGERLPVATAKRIIRKGFKEAGYRAVFRK
jgi:hypothetical protein